jgi:transcriptional regulator with XRE-family HTH domain
MSTLVTTTFGAFFAEQRKKRLRISLREFASRHGFDAGNLSKIERGRLAAPQGQELLARYARALEIPEGSEDWYQLHDLAAAENGRIPEDLLSDAEVAGKLPLLFRALRDDPDAEEEQLRAMVDFVRRL